MTSFLKKKPANLAISTAIEQLATENQALGTRKESALGIFKSTVTELENVNSELTANAAEAQRLAHQLLEQSDRNESEIAHNNKVIEKINEIFN